MNKLNMMALVSCITLVGCKTTTESMLSSDNISNFSPLESFEYLLGKKFTSSAGEISFETTTPDVDMPSANELEDEWNDLPEGFEGPSKNDVLSGKAQNPNKTIGDDGNNIEPSESPDRINAYALINDKRKFMRLYPEDSLILVEPAEAPSVMEGTMSRQDQGARTVQRVIDNSRNNDTDLSEHSSGNNDIKRSRNQGMIRIFVSLDKTKIAICESSATAYAPSNCKGTAGDITFGEYTVNFQSPDTW